MSSPLQPQISCTYMYRRDNLWRHSTYKMSLGMSRNCGRCVESTSGPCPVPHESSSHPFTLFTILYSKIYFSIVFPSVSSCNNRIPPFRFNEQIFLLSLPCLLGVLAPRMAPHSILLSQYYFIQLHIVKLLNSLWNIHHSLVSSLGEQFWLKCKMKVKLLGK
jgi:hypothetical protein